MGHIVTDPAVLTATIAVVSLAYFLLRGGHDPREPPLAPKSIPIVGHLVGLSRRGFNYYVDLR